KPSDQDRLSAIVVEIGDIAAAIDSLEPRLRAERLVASDIVCQQVRSQFAKVMRALVEASLAVHAANRDFTAFADHMNRSDVSWTSLNPAFPLFAGAPVDPNGPLARFLGDAVEGGWLKSSDMPMEFR
ncbi:MAG: hypothetical protein ABI697_12725, partial [Devosia sp.]